ncbi:MAG TPA: hypothetical protein DCW31_00010 [Lactobacillus sp.]|nr:hypothetical protein [Lactobacillus sp.]
MIINKLALDVLIDGILIAAPDRAPFPWDRSQPPKIGVFDLDFEPKRGLEDRPAQLSGAELAA